MALITCPECRKKISDVADSCPNCGYKLTSEKIADIKKEEKKVTNIATFITIFIFIIFIIFISGSPSNTETATPKVETRQEKIEKHFSVWDGSHRALTQVIKKSMHNPDSYQHVETIVWDGGDHLIVKTTYRGTNRFGGIVKNLVRAKVDLNGHVIEIISQEP